MDTFERTVIDGGQRVDADRTRHPCLSFDVETSSSRRAQYTLNTKTRCCLYFSRREVTPVSTQKLPRSRPKEKFRLSLE